MSDDTRIAAVTTVIEGRTEAVRAKDAVRVLSCYAPDAVRFDLAPPLVASGSAADARTGLEAWFDTWDGPIRYVLRDFAVRVAGDLALAHGLVRIGGHKIGAGSIDVWARQTIGLVEHDGAWRIVHEHTSTPFYMDGSLKAAVDLHP